MDLCNPKVIKEVMGLAKTGFRHDLGQNFLINPEIPERIADECSDTPHCTVLEIGPGIGCLTKELAERYESVVSVEIDSSLIPILDKTLADYGNVKVINSDIMKVDIPALMREEAGVRPAYVCANLPYYITTPILMQLLECGYKFKKITVMVQNEVASRLCANAGSADYGAITVSLAYYGAVKKLFGVPAGCFMPAPKVNSAVVQIDIYDTPMYNPKNEKLMFGLIRAAFDMRRKTLVNAISSKFPTLTKDKVASALSMIGIREDIRGERLDVSEFCALADVLCEYL